MQRIPYCFRRGATYYWRRRCAGQSSPFTFSLGVKDQPSARRLSLQLAAASDVAFSAVEAGKMTREEAEAYLRQCFEKQKIKIDLVHQNALDSGGDWQTEATETTASALAFKLLSMRGLNASLTDKELANIGRGEYGQALTEKLPNTLNTYRHIHWSDAEINRLRHDLSTLLNREDISAAEIIQAREIKLKAYSMAAYKCLERFNVLPDNLEDLFQSSELTSTPEYSPGSASNAETVKSDDSDAPVRSEEDRLKADILTLTEKQIVRQSKLKQITPKTAIQMRQVMGLFVEAIGKSNIEDVTQDDIAQFGDTLLLLPKNYRKSPRQREMTLEQIIAEADAKTAGLSKAVINRNMSFLGKFLEFSKGRGLRLDNELSTSSQRVRRTGRARDARPSFTENDLKVLFAHPVWKGCKSKSRRHLPGRWQVRDGLYWVPFIAAYSGARLEEIAGLFISEVFPDDEIPYFAIKENENRRLKNIQSKRDVPIHPDLVQLGFLDYVRSTKKRGSTLLFPELKPSSNAGTFGGRIDDPFRKSVELTLGENRFVKGVPKTFHSIRHYVIGYLRKHSGTKERVVDDIVGHEVLIST